MLELVNSLSLSQLTLFSSIFVMVGLVGWYSGTLQHGHLNFGDGGVLGSYTEILGRNTVGADIVNSGAANNLDFLIPAGTLGTQRQLVVTILGDFLNNTAGALAPMKIDVQLGGISGCIFFTAATVPNSPTRYVWKMVAIISALNVSNSQMGAGWFQMAAGVSGTLLAPTFDLFGGRDDAAGGGFNVDTSIDQTLRIQQTNQTVNANYASRILSATVAVF